MVSRGISRPIAALCGSAKKIGGGEFVLTPPDESSKEVYELSTAMNEMQQRLKNYDSTQKAFLKNASHEFRTPLMSIQGCAEGVLSGVLPDSRAAAQVICSESKHLNLLVEELLTLSRIENQTYKENLTELNLSDVIKDYIQRIDGLALKEGKRIELKTLNPVIPVVSDESLLSQAVTNVVSNCIRYSKSSVRIEVSYQGERALIKVTDDGRGIDVKDLPHLFERFYKGKGAISGSVSPLPNLPFNT